MDDYLLNRRTMEEEFEIIEECVDANIPIPEEKTVLSLKKTKPGTKQKKIVTGELTTKTLKSS